MDSGTGKPLNNYDQVSRSLEFTLYSAVNSELLDIFLLFATPLMQVNVIFFKAWYILDTIPFPDIWFADIFSHSIGCFFTLLTSFALKKFFTLM